MTSFDVAAHPHAKSAIACAVIVLRLFESLVSCIRTLSSAATVTPVSDAPDIVACFASIADCNPEVLAIDRAASAIAVAFPVLVTGPVRLAFVVTVAAFHVILPTIAFVTSRSANQPFVTRAPVAPIEPVRVILLVQSARFPHDTVNPAVAVDTVMFAVPSKLTHPIVRAFWRAVAVPALPETLV